MENLSKLQDVLFPNFEDTIEGKWIVHFCYQKLKLSSINPYVAYDIKAVEPDWETNWFRQVKEPFYPCLKYRIPADKNIDGTNHFMVAESMPESDLLFQLRIHNEIVSKFR